jgi:hypothetical protein
MNAAQIIAKAHSAFIASSPLETANRNHFLVAVLYVVSLFVVAVLSLLLWTSGNRVQDAVQAIANARIADSAKQQVEVRLSAGVSFVSSDQVRTAAEDAGVDQASAEALVEDYESSQINALKTAFLFAALIVLASFFATRRLPTERFDEIEAARGPPGEPALANA